MAPPTTVTVIGAGTMGRGIAMAALRSGRRVVLVDVEQSVLDAAAAHVADHFNRKPAAAAVELRTSTDLESAVAGAGVVIEAVPEIPDLKADVFKRLTAADPSTLLVSNTSTMSITGLAEACAGSDRVVGMHFFNPAHRMPLVEVVVGERTSDQARDDAVSLAVALGKDPVVVRDEPGFVTSRLGLLLGTEALRVVAQGVASAADIDKAMKPNYDHPMEPNMLADLCSLDAQLNNLRSMYDRTGDDRYRPPEILESLVTEGRLGKKTGSGFFSYDEVAS
jgi:3-hydroxybutyryl-CoA dehydrogenase